MRNKIRVLAGGCFVVALGACGGGGDDGQGAGSTTRLMPTLTIALRHSDLVFDSTRQLLYAVVSGDASTPPKIVAVTNASGQVQDVVAPSDPPSYRFVEPVQGTLSLSAQARYLYFTTTGGAVSRVNLATNALDLTLSAPTTSNAKVSAVAASLTEDATAYVELVSDGNDPDAIGVLRSTEWGTQWVSVPRHPLVATTLAVRSDDAELISWSNVLHRVRIGPDGPEVVLAARSIPDVRQPHLPQYVSGGVLANARIYDPATLTFLFDVPGAEACGVLPSRTRLVCAAPAASTGHEFFVFDLPTRSRVATWMAGFDTGTILVTTPALRVTPIGAGRVAVSYGSTNKLGTFGPSQLTIYSNAAFN